MCNSESFNGHIAHIVKIGEKTYIQSVKEHCKNTAIYASNALRNIGLSDTGAFIGYIHDMGKSTGAFNSYILKSFNNEPVAKGSVNHSFAAVIYILEHWHKNEKNLCAEILAWVVGSHHGEFDVFDLNSKNGFNHRLKTDKNEIFYDEAVKNFCAECIDEIELERLFRSSEAEINSVINSIRNSCTKNRYCISVGANKGKAMSFIVGFLSRLILSALIDADRRDTAEFMLQKKYGFISADRTLWERELEFFEEKTSYFKPSPINDVRKFISDSVKIFSQRESGIYTLCVPTGSGKTLSSLRYALSHAAIHGKKHIFFVIPLLSILEQNAKIISDYTCGEICTEHHSNIVINDFSKDEADKYELISQTWDSPVIVTTLVQLLNTLFSSDTSSIRRMKSLCNSVIVIDEIQTLPKKVTYMFNLAISFLSDFCGADIVLSSATQPCISEVNYRLALSENHEMVKLPAEMKAVFKRTDIVDKTSAPMTITELSDLSSELIEENQSLLIICNTKSSAKKLFFELETLCKGRYKLFHLSTSMCTEHRKETLAEINEILGKRQEKIICVSTQLVEAGVDFSFECCIRVLAGMDNVAQAAGRCNRSGDFGHICKVYIVRLIDENLKFLLEIKASQNSSTELFEYYKNNPEKYGSDLLSNESIEEFYRLLYKKHTKEYELGYAEKDDSLFDMLSVNNKYRERADGKNEFMLSQSFKTAGELFKVFDEDTTDIIVPYNDVAKSVIADIGSQKAEYDIAFLKAAVERAKPFTISIFKYQLDALWSSDYVHYIDKDKRFIALSENAYNSQTGLEDNNFIH